MEITLPNKTTITIYSKSKCDNCLKIKDLLIEEDIEFVEINCDKYLIDDQRKQEFIKLLRLDTSKITFPLVYNKEKLIGSYHETIHFLSYNYNNEF